MTPELPTNQPAAPAVRGDIPPAPRTGDPNSHILGEQHFLTADELAEIVDDLRDREQETGRPYTVSVRAPKPIIEAVRRRRTQRRQHPLFGGPRRETAA